MSMFNQLREDFKDDVLNQSVNNNVVYVETDLADDSQRTITLQDATAYTTLGDQLSATVLNEIGDVVNSIGDQVEVNVGDIAANTSNITTNTNNITNLLAGKINIDTSAAAGTIDGDLYAAIVALGWESDVIV